VDNIKMNILFYEVNLIGIADVSGLGDEPLDCVKAGSFWRL
jgi:hypothetical protein